MKNTKIFKSKLQSGSAILTTIFLLFGITAVAMIGIEIIMNGLNARRVQGASLRSFYAAESGIERSLSVVRNMQGEIFNDTTCSANQNWYLNYTKINNGTPNDNCQNSPRPTINMALFYPEPAIPFYSVRQSQIGREINLMSVGGLEIRGQWERVSRQLNVNLCVPNCSGYTDDGNDANDPDGCGGTCTSTSIGGGFGGNAGSLGSLCSDNSDCNSGLICQGGTCQFAVCVPACGGKTDTCDGGVCKCGAGPECNNGSICQSGSCVSDCSTNNDYTANCPATPSIGCKCGGGTVICNENTSYCSNQKIIVAPSNCSNLSCDGSGTDSVDFSWDTSITPVQTNNSNMINGSSNFWDNPDRFNASNYAAAYYCLSLNAQGKTDWYLPTRQEACLILRSSNVGTATQPTSCDPGSGAGQGCLPGLPATKPVQGYYDNYYWISMENDQTTAFSIYSGNGSYYSRNKRTFLLRARCLRRF